MAAVSIVYFITCRRRIKVGITRRPLAERLYDLSVTNPDPITVIGTVPGGLGEERIIHRRLVEYRIGREWFRDEPGARRIIAQCIAEPPIATKFNKPGRKQYVPPPPPEARVEPPNDAAHDRWRAHIAFCETHVPEMRTLPDGIRWAIKDAVDTARTIYLSLIWDISKEEYRDAAIKGVFTAFGRAELLIENHLTCARVLAS
jgi:hypothetical protein